MDDIRAQIILLMRQAHSTVLAFFSILDQAELENSGSTEAWQPKDVLAHIVEWQAITSHRLAAARRGESPAAYPDLNEKNDEIFKQYLTFSYLDIQVHADEILQELASQIEYFPLDDFSDPDRYPWLNEQPLFWRVAHSLNYHPNHHIAQLQLLRGDRHAADELMTETTRNLLALDTSPRWQGLYLYNLGCHYAQANDPALAIEQLALAFAVRRELIEWSKSDTRLSSLHQLAQYQNLVSAG